MMRSRMNHWSCSVFADWVRGEKKPMALEFGEWEKWHEEASSRRPVRHFIAEEVLDRIQDFILLPWDMSDSFRSWWHNRFVSKSHFIKTGLQPGRFHELDERILHGLFNELVEFVEVDLAMQQAFGDKSYEFKRGRCREAGLDHLRWSSDLRFGPDEFVSEKDRMYGKPTPQAKSSMVIAELYNWWTETRPNRPDPSEASGWSALFEAEDSKEKRAALKKLWKMEQDYDREDEKMLIRLVKIRKHLWT